MQKAAQAGIKIQSISELSPFSPDWKHKLWELRWQIWQDIPSPQPRTREPLEEFEKRLHSHPNFNPDAWFIAVDEGEYVAYSNLEVTSTPPPTPPLPHSPSPTPPLPLPHSLFPFRQSSEYPQSLLRTFQSDVAIVVEE